MNNNRRSAPKARDQFNEDAARGRRRQNVQHESARQRDVNLRARRLATELSGAANGEVSAAELAALGPDVLAPRSRALAADLHNWREAQPAEWLRVLQQMVALLSTGVYQVVEAAVSCEVVPLLAAVLQQPDSQLPPGAARTAAYALELIASDSSTAAFAVQPAVPALAARLSAAVVALAPGHGPGGGGGGAASDREAALLEASQLAGTLGAMAGWGRERQQSLTEVGVASSLVQLLLATVDGASEAVSPSVATAAQLAATGPQQQQQQQLLPEQVAALQPGADPAEVQCCSTALWAVGMLVREWGEAVTQLVSQTALLAGLRRVLMAPAPHPELLRAVAWVLAFCTSPCAGPAATVALMDGGGLLPGLLLSAMRVASYAAALTPLRAGGGDRDDDDIEDPALTAAAQPLRQTLLPLLYATANIAADPAHTLRVLSELQAARPLQPAANQSATGMEMVLACLRNRVGHRRVQAGAASLAAALAGGACGAGPAAVGAVRNALRDAGVTRVLESLLVSRSGILVRKEAATALALLVEGATGNEPRPGRVAMLRELGVLPRRDERGVLAAFLELLRGADGDAVHAALRFATMVLGELRPGAKHLVETLDGIDALEAAQEGRSGLAAPELQAWAQRLVDDNWGIDAEEEEEEEEADGEGEMEE
ncbi:hypothetical protein PLESTB_000525100 [Pleodorina starrii]|uniref:Uncharacterized protein n=1 Tax=Pleodorina starrii TaxID=330485 RepID=A0A9W6BGE1_9CHLO|nr:hypothetical protein PLESTM_000388500 [Pleodorina starrii]GLC51649.1 hypothetical protein PLESTB_000525100 [Pleodorina starrii]GLC72417.1 hypothetical protein PLESTF_001245400 [Pleodorina starrii]